MKYYILKRRDGKYLNTGYPRTIAQSWRDEPRLYRTPQGVRTAMGRVAWPSLQKKLGPVPAWEGVGASRDNIAAREAYFKAMSKIKTPEYFKILEEDGFELIEKEVVL